MRTSPTLGVRNNHAMINNIAKRKSYCVTVEWAAWRPFRPISCHHGLRFLIALKFGRKSLNYPLRSVFEQLRVCSMCRSIHSEVSYNTFALDEELDHKPWILTRAHKFISSKQVPSSRSGAIPSLGSCFGFLRILNRINGVLTALPTIGP